MDSLSDEGFNTLRIDENLAQANLIYDTTMISHSKKDEDFKTVIAYCEEIKNVYGLAFITRDELNALMRFYNESITSSMNSTNVDLVISNLREEITNERYEKVEDLVNEAYDAIITLQSENTALQTIRRNTRNILLRFFPPFLNNI